MNRQIGMGRVGFEPTTPAMSRRYLNQAGPPALTAFPILHPKYVLKRHGLHPMSHSVK
jgi:hypothetical protein